MKTIRLHVTTDQLEILQKLVEDEIDFTADELMNPPPPDEAFATRWTMEELQDLLEAVSH